MQSNSRKIPSFISLSLSSRYKGPKKLTINSVGLKTPDNWSDQDSSFGPWFCRWKF